MKVYQIPVLNDNYIYLLRDDKVNFTAVVDPALAQPVVQFLRDHQWDLDAILNTHHHSDHIGANLELKDTYPCKIFGFDGDAQRIPGITDLVTDGENLKFGSTTCQVIFTPGHTLGHICYYFSGQGYLFCGDTLFSFGCGRLFEGTPAQMLASLKKIRSLPDDTQFFCAHEYTLTNIRYAVSIDPDNQQLTDYANHIKKLRDDGTPTIPALLKVEKKLSPFLRWDDPSLAKALKIPQASELEVFTLVRQQRNLFQT